MNSKLASRAVVAAFALTTVYFSGRFPPSTNPNELSRLETVYAVVEHATFRIDAAIPVLGDHEDKAVSGGSFYSNKAPGLALAAVPVYRLLRVFAPAPRSASDVLFVWLRLLTVSSVCTLALARFARRLDPWPAGALAAFAVAFGTPFLFYARSFFAHAWVASLLFLAWDGIRLARERERERERERMRPATALLAGAGLLAGWAAISEYTVAPIVLLLALSTGSGPRLLRFAAGAALPVGVLLGYDAICFGSPFVLSSAREAHAGYSELADRGFFGFTWPSPSVVAGYLAHPARGLLLFSPFWLWAVPGFARWLRDGRERAEALGALLVVVLFFVLLTGYPNWHGGWALGNRYLLPVVFFAGLALPRALSTPLSRGVFAIAALFAAMVYLLLTASWPYFPLYLPWPPASGSLWFVSRGWIAPNLLSGWGLLSLVPPAVAAAVAASVALRSAGRLVPSAAAATCAALVLFAVPLVFGPQPPYGGRLWRAAVYGAYSGLDPGREELRRVVSEASTPLERRQATGAWRLEGPKTTAPQPE